MSVVRITSKMCSKAGVALNSLVENPGPKTSSSARTPASLSSLYSLHVLQQLNAAALPSHSHYTLVLSGTLPRHLWIQAQAEALIPGYTCVASLHPLNLEVDFVEPQGDFLWKTSCV